MNCPYCRSNQTTCIDSREQPNNLKRRRRYKCLECGKRYSTLETIVPDTPKEKGEPSVKEPSKRSQRFKGETAEEKTMRTLSCYQSGKVSRGGTS